jgi:hypothetical protein
VTGWRRSSFCDTGTCVEVAEVDVPKDPKHLLRDGKEEDGLVLAFGTQDWRNFLTALKQGDFE